MPLLNQIKFTYRELRFGLLVGTLAQNPTNLGKINELHEIDLKMYTLYTQETSS